MNIVLLHNCVNLSFWQIHYYLTSLSHPKVHLRTGTPHHKILILHLNWIVLIPSTWILRIVYFLVVLNWHNQLFEAIMSKRILNTRYTIFSIMLKKTSLSSNEEYAWYVAKALFPNTHMDYCKAITYIINEISHKDRLTQIYIKIIFKRLFYKLTTEVPFQFKTT